MARQPQYRITNIYFITSVAVIGGALFGFDIAGMSAILGTDQYKCYFNQGPHGPPFTDEIHCSGPTPTVQGGITASMPGGSLIGSIISGYLSDMIGRKAAIQWGSIVWCVGCVITCACQNIPMLCVGRFINGFAVGICSAQVPVYVSELAPPSKRGRVVGAQQWALTWGMIAIFYISYGTSFLSGTSSFRIPWGVQAVPGVLLGIGLFFTPESPRYLARKDRWEEAEDVLASVHSKGDRNSPFVRRELLEIRAACEAETNNKSSYLDLFKRDMIYRTHVGIFTQVWSQLTGINALMYYITYIFGMAGLTGSVNLYSSSIQYVINMVVTIPTLIWVDRWGRRWPIILGSIFMALWMFLCGGLMAGYGSPAPPGGVDHVPQLSWEIRGPASKAAIASTYLFVATYGMTLAPISWIYCAELFPLHIRGKAVSVTTAANWTFNFALSWFVPSAFVNIKWKTFILFGCFLVAMTFHFFFCFPETSGKTLEEIEEVFTSKTKAWHTHVGIAHAKQLEATGFAADDTVHMKEAVENATHLEVIQPEKC